MLPNFLIIGAAKSGTSSLYEYLKTHPEVFMTPIKEPNFFALEGDKPEFLVPELKRKLKGKLAVDLRSYCRLFHGARDETAIGEASSWYLHSEKAPERIQHYAPNAKLIAILRNPIDRAYSAYRMHVRIGTERAPSFAEALAQQSQRQGTWNWGLDYLQPGFYYRHLKRYFERFNASQLRIYLYEDFAADSGAIVRDIYEYLGVDPTFVPGNLSTRYNQSGELLERLRSSWNLRAPSRLQIPALPRKYVVAEYPRLPDDLRKWLAAIYRDDILQLRQLIKRDVSHWLD